MPNNIVFSNPGASIIRWGDGVAAPYLTLSVNGSTALVGAAVTGTVTNTGSAAGQWSVASAPADVLVSPSSGTLAVNAFASFTLTALAAGAKVITLSSSTPGATITNTPVSLTVTSPSPPPPPPPPPPPSSAVSSSSAYRINQTRLFADVPATTPTTGSDSSEFYALARASVADPKANYLLGTFGPSATNVDHYSKWAWANSGGDWINTAGTAQATTLPHVTFTANSVTSGGASYTANILSAATAARTRGKWFALILKATGSTRKIASLHHATLPPPSVAVTYSDGTTATLACTACVRLTTGTSYSLIGSDEATCGTVAIEFEMPAKGMTAATLNITCATHDSTPTTINGYLANPPVSTSPVTSGVAASYPGDVGITADPSVLFVQRYVDGTSLSDYILTGISPNVFLKSDWDAGLWGGTDDTTKLPTAHAGTAVAGTNKWIYKQNTAAQLSIVDSTHTGDNFEPVAPGLGALRIVMPASTAADGGNAGYFGSLGSDLWALFPKTISGLTDELFVRFKFRVASQPETLANTKMLRTEGGATAEYAVAAGKFGIGGHHWTQFGGNDNVGGGSRGWSARLKYNEFPLDSPVSAYGAGVHAYDQLGADFYFGKQGLGASFYPDTWYDLEVRLKLNTWAPSGAGASDGVCEVWIDGKLDSTHTGWKFRDGPLDAGRTASVNFSPFREIGHIGLCLNSYNGGVKAPDHDITVFYANVVAGTSRIGPMTQPVPTWAASLTPDAWTTLAAGSDYMDWANAGGIPAGSYIGSSPFSSIVEAYCDPAWDGARYQHFYGGGHGDGTCNAVPTFDWYTLQWSLTGTPTPPAKYPPKYGSDRLSWGGSTLQPGPLEYPSGVLGAGFFLDAPPLVSGLDTPYATPTARASSHMYSGAEMRSLSGVIHYFYERYAEFNTLTQTWGGQGVDLGAQLVTFRPQYNAVNLQQGTVAIYDDVTDRFFVSLVPGDYGGGWRSAVLVFNPNNRQIEAVLESNDSNFGLFLSANTAVKVGRKLYWFVPSTAAQFTLAGGFAMDMDQAATKTGLQSLSESYCQKFTISGFSEANVAPQNPQQQTIPTFYDGTSIHRWNYSSPLTNYLYTLNLTPASGAGTIASPYVLTQTRRTLANTPPGTYRWIYKRLVWIPAANCAAMIGDPAQPAVALKLS